MAIPPIGTVREWGKLDSEHRDALNRTTSQMWDREYDTHQSIPSSTRELPSKALLLVSDLLNLLRGAGRALDAGSGNGRNAVYLAEHGWRVDAVDSSVEAHARMATLVEKRHVGNLVKVHNFSLFGGFPFSDDTFDLAIDSYVFCHFLDEELRRSFRDELHRTLKPDAFLFSAAFSFHDEYYRRFVNQRTRLATDPTNGVTKRLYDLEELQQFFGEKFREVYYADFRFQDTVSGQRLWRSVLVSVLAK